MDTNTQDIKEFLLTLPPDLLSVIMHDEWRLKARSIAAAHKLSTNETKSLILQIFLVIGGMKPISRFRNSLVNDAGITYDQAIKVAYETNNQVFNPVMEILKNLDEEIAEDENDASPKTETSEFEDDKKVSAEELINHLLPTHDVLEKTANGHTHTQTQTIVQPPQTVTQPITPAAHTVPSSIVDQKLRGLVRANREELSVRDDVEKRRKIIYKDSDPYREPVE